MKDIETHSIAAQGESMTRDSSSGEALDRLQQRRRFLKWGLGAVAGGAALAGSATASAAGHCRLTPPQTSGPFYPGDKNFEELMDLTTVPGAANRALGEIVYIRGQVLDEACRPVEGANVEIWQACHSGRYNHDSDPNPAPLDPNFRYWGEAFTNEKGEYLFKTIIPGAYPATPDWERPPHIHYRVAKRGHQELVTQMYFAGEALNKGDRILQNLDPQDQEAVVVAFSADLEEGMEPGALLGTFNLTLPRV